MCSFSALLGSVRIKAARRMLMKLTPGVDFTKLFFSKQKVVGPQKNSLINFTKK